MVFETSAFNHSATSPAGNLFNLSPRNLQGSVTIRDDV